MLFVCLHKQASGEAASKCLNAGSFNVIGVVPANDASAHMGLLLGRLSQSEPSNSSQTYAIEVHFCGSRKDEVSSPPSITTECCCRNVSRVSVQNDIGSLLGKGVHVQQVKEANAINEMLILSVLVAVKRNSQDDKEENIVGRHHRLSWWLLIYKLPHPSDAAGQEGSTAVANLLRAFPSPTGESLQFLDWLDPVEPSPADILSLARDDLLLASGVSPSTVPEETVIWSLVMWSRCSICVLRFLGRKGVVKNDVSYIPMLGYTTTIQRRLRHPDTAKTLLPAGSVSGFIGSLVTSNQIDGAISLGWSLLLRSPAPAGPPLHSRYLKLLTGTDPFLDEASGSSKLAAQLVGWMTQSKSWTKVHLLKFLEVCQDYRLKEVVDVLLENGRVSEALYCSWVRQGATGLEATLEQIASSSSSSSTSLQLNPSDVTWLCGVGAGAAIVWAGHSMLWTALPVQLQIEVVLSDSDLFLAPEQYQWLLTVLTNIPSFCLSALVLHLITWLDLCPDSFSICATTTSQQSNILGIDER